MAALWLYLELSAWRARRRRRQAGTRPWPPLAGHAQPKEA
jgi:hypothetical protein